jgi:hypothetical protein
MTVELKATIRYPARRPLDSVLVLRTNGLAAKTANLLDDIILITIRNYSV